MFAVFVSSNRGGVTTFGIIVNALVTATMMPCCVFAAALAGPAVAQTPSTVPLQIAAPKAAEETASTTTDLETTQDTGSVQLASRPPDATHDIPAGFGLAASGNGHVPKSLWDEVVSEDTDSPSPPPEELRLASLPVSSLVLDPFLFSAISRKAEPVDPVPDVPAEDIPSPDVATLVAEYLPEKIESLVETAAALQAPVQAEGETTPSDTVQEETQALFVDSETSELKNPPVELLPGIRIAVLSPVEGVALKAVARNAGKARMKSGEGEGEPEGEAEGEGEANPFDLLDLESDFVVFLDGFFEEYTPGQETTADLNAISVQTTGSFREILPAPNGIPDLAELLLLQRFLQDETLDFSLSGGPSHEDAADRWEYFETLYGPVADPTLAPVYRVGLAYSCLDDFMSMYLGAALLSIATEVELDGMNVLAALQTTTYAFCQSADVDGDDYSTLLEWQHYGTGQTFAAAYTAFEAAALNPAVYPASVDLYTVTRTCGQNILLFYPPVEKVADGMTLSDYAVFGYDPAQFTQEPFFDHWVITGESALSPRYSGADQIEVLVEDDVTIEHTVLAPDLSASVTFPDAALEAAVRTAIGKPTGALVLGDVYDPDFTELSATNAGIVSLDGLQHCRYLTQIVLSRNAVETLTPLSTLYRLTNLDLGCNLIEDVTPLANLHDLKHLELGIMFLSYLFNPTLVNYNRPEDLAPLVSLKRLEYLGLTDSGLEEEALAPLAALDTLLALSIGKSPGVDLSPVASMDGLLLLIDHDSGLTDTDLNALSTVSGLMSVFLYNNDLDDLDALANCMNMQEVYVHNNPNFDVVPDTFPSMTVFGADECALTDISALGDLSVVQELSLSDNEINDITPLLDIATFGENASINLLDNPLVHVDTCTTITALRAQGVDVEENAGQCRRTLTYTAGPHGSIQGTSPQVVYLGNDGAPVQAVPATGHFFFQWSDERTDNPRTDTNVTENSTVTAQFLPYQYPLVYLAGEYGVIDGPTPQIVDHGEDGLPVTAVPDYGYHFTDWDDGYIDNPRIDTANTEPLTVTAAFDINQYDLFYSAESHGHLSGEPIQLVNHGECGSMVEAVPDAGYHFSRWSDDFSEVQRMDCGNTEPLAVSAYFVGNEYTLSFDAQGGTTPVPATRPVTFGDIYGVLPATTRTAYTFVGWWTAPNGGTRVQPSSVVTYPGDHTIYARWNPRYFFVNFDSQGGSVPIPRSKTATYGNPYGPLPVTSREGYLFTGWWTAPTGGNEVTPETLMMNVRLEHTLYARWNQVTTTIYYQAGVNGSISGDAEQQVAYGACGTPVTAVPNTGYHFLLWDDDSDDNPRIDCYNTEPLTVTAGFAVNQYTLTYTAGNNGAVSGTAQQQVNHGESGSAVTAIPDTGYNFVQWGDGSTANPRTDTNVTGNIAVTAVFSLPAQYVLHYTAGSCGTLQGQAEQSVPGGNSGTAVTAVANTGWHFLQWSDASTTNPRTDTNVQAHLSVTALFAPDQYTLNYASEANGCIWGPVAQNVNHGATGALVVALPNEGYRFDAWSDSWTNPAGPQANAFRKDANVTANVNVTAAFTPLQYTLAYTAGPNGSLLGAAPQTVNCGQNGTPVQAVPEAGYRFSRWSDGSTANPRTDLNVKRNVSVTADFADIFDDDFDLAQFLEVWMAYLRDTGATPPQDTLTWFRDDLGAMYDHVLTLNWGSTYNLWLAWVYGTVNMQNSPLAVECAGLLNLNLETQGMAVPDIVELHVLEAILKDSSHPLHASVKEAYLANLALWQIYDDAAAAALPQFVPPPMGVTYALAAYGTLDALAGPLAASFYGVHVSQLYGTATPQPPGSFSVVPEFQQSADIDGDGFTNLEESLYVAHRYEETVGDALDCSNPQGLQYTALDIYGMYLDDSAKVPVFDPAATDRNTPTCVKVTLNHEGDGAILPFEGSAYLSKYNLLDWYAWIADANNDPEHDTPGAACEAASLYVEAQPEENGILDYWELRDGSLGEIMAASDITPDRLWRLTKPVLTVPLTRDTELTGLFESRAEIAELDLIGHLGNFLVYIGALENAGEVLQSSWDLGGFTEEDGNGVPDTAEFYLLQHILESAGLDLTENHGLHSGIVYAAWAHNMAEARADLPQQQLEVQRTVAAYMTLGYSTAIRPVIDDKYGVTLDEQTYDAESARWLAAEGDVTFDGIENRQAWADVVNGGATGMTALQAFAQKAFDPGTSGGGQGQAIVTANNCVPYPNGTVTVNINDTYMPSGSVLLEVQGVTDDCSAEVLMKHSNPGVGTAVHLGHTVTVSVKNNLHPDLGAFKCWSAPGTLIHGCPSLKASFILSKAVSIRATYVNASQTTTFVPAENIPQNIAMSLEGPKTDTQPVYGPNGVFLGRNVMSQPGKVLYVSFTSCDFGMVPMFRDKNGSTVNYCGGALLPSKDNLKSYWVGCGFRPISGKLTVTTRVVPNIAIAPVQRTYSEADGFARQTVLPAGSVCNGSPLLQECPPGFSRVEGDSTVTPFSATFTHKMGLCPTLSVAGGGEQGYVDPCENPKFFYDPGQGINGGTERVTLKAIASCGYHFKEWSGEGACYPGSGTTPVTLNGCENPLITLVMNKNRSVVPVFDSAQVTNFSLSTYQEQRTSCQSGPNGGQEIKQIFTYSWNSSSGYLSDLKGKIVEVLCYDINVTEEERISCLEKNRARILYVPVDIDDELSCSPGELAVIDQLFIPAILRTTPERFYYRATWNVTAGMLQDEHGFSIPCRLSCESGFYIVYQYYYHVPECSEIRRVAGAYPITRSSSGGRSTVSVSKHSYILSTNCDWSECQCP